MKKERINKSELIDLADKRTKALDRADKAYRDHRKDDYDAAMADVDRLNEAIDMAQKLIAQEERDAALEQAHGGDRGLADVDRTAQIRASREYTRAFCNAVRARLAPVTARGRDGYDILLNALTEGVNENGGFLVPVDLQTRINELRRQFVNLRSLVHVEPVTAPTGYRVLDSAPTKGFTKMSEMGQVPTDDQPDFSRYEYKVEDFGLIVPISNDLLSDNDAALLEYLARWMAKKATLTENTLILSLLATVKSTTVAAGRELAAIKSALNVTLDPDIALNAAILSNQTSYNVLDLLEDSNNRPLLQPDISATSGYQIKGKHVTAVANRQLADTAEGSPLYIGDFTSAITLFDRQIMEFAATNIGGSAWRTNSTEGRAIMRLDVKQVDKDAVASLKLAAGGSGSASESDATDESGTTGAAG